MRKYLIKEVTSTTVKLAKMEIVEGLPQAIAMDDLVILGNVDQEKAQKIASKEFGQGVTVFGLEANTKTYEMSVEEFIKVATLKVDQPELAI
jgi:hypothetical protein